MPALATSTSTGPVRLLDLGERRSTCAVSVTSQRHRQDSPSGGSPDAVRDGDLVAGVGERTGDGEADAPVSTGDEDRAAHGRPFHSGLAPRPTATAVRDATVAGPGRWAPRCPPAGSVRMRTQWPRGDRRRFTAPSPGAPSPTPRWHGARALGAEHADFRVERVRSASCGCATPASLARSTTTRSRARRPRRPRRRLGVRRRRRPHRRTRPHGSPSRRSPWPGCRQDRSPTERVELAPEPVHADAAWISSYDVDPFDVPDAEKAALLAELERRLLARRTGSTTSTRRVYAVMESKFYADTAGTATTQQRVRLRAAAHRRRGRRASGAFETMRTLAPPAGRGWEYLHGHRLGLGRRARRAARSCWPSSRGAVGRGGQLRPGHRPDEPVADHPRVDRPRHRAGPGARLRGQLRGHLVRDVRPARHAALRLAR